MALKILIADDHELVRDMIAAYLAREPGIEVETASDNGAVARRLRAGEMYDLVLLDYNMPGMNGLDGLKATKEATRGRPVALISGSANRAVAEAALAQGAMGFLPKNMAAKSLIHAIRLMAAGVQFAPVQFMTEKPETVENELAVQLSKREVDVLRGLMQGKSNKEIARDIEVQEVTVKLHVKTLCRKINARNRTHAAMIAKEAGLE